MMFDKPDNSSLDVSKNPVHQHEETAPQLSLLGEMTTSAANQARTIYNGVAQLSETIGIGHLQEVQLTEQRSAPTLSARWWAQEAGATAVSLPLVLGMHKAAGMAMSSVDSSLATRATIAGASETFGVGHMAMTGALYEGIFKPTSLSDAGRSANGDSLAYARFKQAAEGGLSFAAMRIVGGRTAGSISGPLDKVVSGMSAGATYGLVHEQSRSAFEEGKIAAVSKSLDAAARGAVLGTALSGLSMFNPAEASDMTPVRQTGQSASLGRSLAGKDILNENTSLRTARTFSNNGQHAEALPHLEKALEAARINHGPTSLEAAEILKEQARSNMFLGKNETAMTAANSALEIYSARYGERSAEAADVWDQISAIEGRSGHPDRAAAALDKSLTFGREAMQNGAMNPMQSFEFKAEEADRVRRLASMYEGLGNKERAMQVRQEQTPAEQREVEPRL